MNILINPRIRLATMIPHVTTMTNYNQIRKIIIIPVMIYMMNIKSFCGFTQKAMVRKFPECKSTITESSRYKVRIIFSDFAKRSFSRVVVTVYRAIDILRFPFNNFKLNLAKFTNLKYIWIPIFVRALDRAKNSFFRSMMNKFYFAGFANCFYMMIKVVALSTAVEGVKPFISSYNERIFTEIADFFHKVSLPESGFLRNNQPSYHEVLYGLR